MRYEGTYGDIPNCINIDGTVRTYYTERNTQELEKDGFFHLYTTQVPLLKVTKEDVIIERENRNVKSSIAAIVEHNRIANKRKRGSDTAAEIKILTIQAGQSEIVPASDIREFDMLYKRYGLTHLFK